MLLPRRITAFARITKKRTMFPRTIDRCHECKKGSTSSVPKIVAGGIVGLGFLCAHTPAPRTFAEASVSGPRRRRPLTFGPSVPKVTARGLATSNSSDRALPDIANRADCLLCKKFGSGPCGDVFQRWLACTDQHPGTSTVGEPLHLSHCADFAEKLAECLDTNTEYYTQSHKEYLGQEQKDGELKEAWEKFVRDMEDGIAAGKFHLLPYPEQLYPKVEVRRASRAGAAFFVPENIVAAYIVDENGNVISAGSRDDMDMGSHGCVLQFRVARGMTSATCCAIYDTEEDEVLVFCRKISFPMDKRSN